MAFYKTIPHIGDFFRIPVCIFFLIGFCTIRWRPNELPKRLQYFLMGLLVFNIVFSICGMSAYCLVGSLETSLEITAYIIYNIFAAVSLLKFFCCVINMNKLRKVLRNIEKYFPKTLQENYDYDLDEHLKALRRYNIGLTIYHFAVTSMFNLFPLAQSIFLYYQNEEITFSYELPFLVVYAFNTKTILGYTYAYVTQCISSYSASCGFLGTDLMLVTCLHLINMNFKHLAKLIRNLKPSGGSDDYKTLRSLIIYHNDILTTIKMIDEIFNIPVFLNFMGAVKIICLIGFQLVVGTDFLDLVKFLSFLISILTHIYFISILGSEMMVLSFEISEAFMHHPWYDADLEYQRAVYLAIARAQQPVHLNASKFFIVSMETFKSLISVSYQFFTLIKTSYVDE